MTLTRPADPLQLAPLTAVSKAKLKTALTEETVAAHRGFFVKKDVVWGFVFFFF